MNVARGSCIAEWGILCAQNRGKVKITLKPGSVMILEIVKATLDASSDVNSELEEKKISLGVGDKSPKQCH